MLRAFWSDTSLTSRNFEWIWSDMPEWIFAFNPAFNPHGTGLRHIKTLPNPSSSWSIWGAIIKHKNLYFWVWQHPLELNCRRDLVSGCQIWDKHLPNIWVLATCCENKIILLRQCCISSWQYFLETSNPTQSSTVLSVNCKGSTSGLVS